MADDDKKPVLHIVTASTRPGRVGEPVTRWIEPIARAHGGFVVEVVDLAEVALPFLDEPVHPFMRQYTHQHTRDWSAKVDAADAFVFVVPEYNHGIGAALKNALDYLFFEWQYKPVGVVSYGGVSGGTRGVQALVGSLWGLKLSLVLENVFIPFVQELIVDGELKANEIMDGAAGRMLNELQRMEGALRPLRNGVRDYVAAG
jgi:NAD(P)H-dependent FMN reductase